MFPSRYYFFMRSTTICSASAFSSSNFQLINVGTFGEYYSFFDRFYFVIKYQREILFYYSLLFTAYYFYCLRYYLFCTRALCIKSKYFCIDSISSLFFARVTSSQLHRSLQTTSISSVITSAHLPQFPPSPWSWKVLFLLGMKWEVAPGNFIRRRDYSPVVSWRKIFAIFSWDYIS